MPNIWCKDTNVTVIGEEFNTRREQRSKGAFAASVVLRVPWNQRYAFMEAMVTEDDGWGASYPGYDSARIASFDVNPFAAQPKLDTDPYEVEEIIYKEALITCNYTNLTRSYVETLEPAAEMRRLPYKRFQWESTAQEESVHVAPEEAPSLPVRTVVYTVAWKRMKTVPPEFHTLVGCVNGRAYVCDTFKGFWLPEQMLYIPTTGNAASYSSNNVPEASLLDFFDYTCKWKVRLGPAECTWNTFYRMIEQQGSEKEERYNYVPIYKKMKTGAPTIFKPYTVDKKETVDGKDAWPMDKLLPPLPPYPPEAP